MMPIKYSPLQPDSNERLKAATATQQIKDILERVAVNSLYQTLTQKDRDLLFDEGYAGTLIDNLVFLTLRSYDSDGHYSDDIVVGLNDFAVDPSLYSSRYVKQHFTAMNHCRCAYCETYIPSSGVVCHIRPPVVLKNNNKIQQSPYGVLAYDYENLVLICSDCYTEKSGVFPLISEKFRGDVTKEQPLLLNPFKDSTREFIRFNPVTGLAFAFDVVKDFAKDTFHLSESELENELYNNPNFAPSQLYECDKSALAIPSSDNDKAFSKWMIDKKLSSYRGFETIRYLNLNRNSLLIERRAHINSIACCGQKIDDSELNKDLVDSEIIAWFEHQLGCVHRFQSLTIDCFRFWLQQYNISATSSEVKKNNTKNATVDSECSESFPIKLSRPKLNEKAFIPEWIQSLLMYMVIESELTMENKRRVVSLRNSDYLYGTDNDQNSVFLPIDWQGDFENVIKVRDSQHTWETSFSELAASIPLEVLQIFSSAEVWAEGDYAPLVKTP